VVYSTKLLFTELKSPGGSAIFAEGDKQTDVHGLQIQSGRKNLFMCEAANGDDSVGKRWHGDLGHTQLDYVDGPPI